MRRKPVTFIEAWTIMAILFLLAVPALPGCGGKRGSPLVLAATRDLEGSGILEAWVEDFQKGSGRTVELVVAPDREVTEMAEHGECDLLLTHLPDEEVGRLERYGYVEGKREVMRDTYLLVGPPDDPAGVRESENIADALKRIADSRRLFLVRVDGSGTAVKMERLWAMTGVSDFLGWIRSEQGTMEEVLRSASREGAYTLCDSSTFRRFAGETELEVLFEGGEELVNSYQVMVVSTLPYPDTDTDGASRFIDYLFSEQARSRLALGAWEPAE